MPIQRRLDGTFGYRPLGTDTAPARLVAAGVALEQASSFGPLGQAIAGSLASLLAAPAAVHMALLAKDEIVLRRAEKKSQNEVTQQFRENVRAAGFKGDQLVGDISDEQLRELAELVVPLVEYETGLPVSLENLIFRFVNADEMFEFGAAPNENPAPRERFAKRFFTVGEYFSQREVLAVNRQLAREYTVDLLFDVLTHELTHRAQFEANANIGTALRAAIRELDAADETEANAPKVKIYEAIFFAIKTFTEGHASYVQSQDRLARFPSRTVKSFRERMHEKLAWWTLSSEERAARRTGESEQNSPYVLGEQLLIEAAECAGASHEKQVETTRGLLLHIDAWVRDFIEKTDPQWAAENGEEIDAVLRQLFERSDGAF